MPQITNLYYIFAFGCFNINIFSIIGYLEITKLLFYKITKYKYLHFKNIIMANIIDDKNDIELYLDKQYRHLLLYARIGTLAMLDYYGKDGLSYQDIKSALRLEDGSLAPNLLWLRNHHYIRIEDSKIDKRKIAVYYIETKGSEAYNKTKLWLSKILQLNNKW